MRHILQTGCLTAGILCLFYFVMIVCYVGSTEWFQFVWLAGGLFLLILWSALLYQASHPDSLIRYVTAAALALILAAVIWIGAVGARIVSAMTADSAEGMDYVIVLGAQVRGTRPSRALRKRLDRALEYAEENPKTMFILSGGQGSDEAISEALCMYNYMEENGLPSERMIMEDRSTSTQENLQFSAAFLEKEKDAVGIVSNNFHIYRALKLAQKEGYRSVSGIPAKSDALMQPHYVLREICAVSVIWMKEKICAEDVPKCRRTSV